MKKASGEATRDRLLRAAGEVFSEQGFHSATVREICRRASVNIASVNYHFSSKEELYEAVLESAFRQAAQNVPPLSPPGSDASPETRLSQYVGRFMMRIIDDRRPAWFGRLMAREILDPTGGHLRVIDNAIRPLHDELRAIVREIAGDRAGEEDLTRAVLSIIGQCIFYKSADLVIRRLYPGLLEDDDRVERTAAHITRFSLAALKATGPRKEDRR